MALGRCVVIGLGSLWLLACKPGAGSSCERGDARCLDPSRALVCEKRKFVETPCRGARGCQTEPGGVSCDVRGNRDGDPCSTDEEGAALCADPKTLVACRGGKYRRSACRGPGGCVEEGGRTRCDASVAEAGAPCGEEGKKACASDGRRVLACTGGRMAPALECRGEHGCRIVAGKIDCDLTVARAGEPCDRLVEGHYACSEDRRALVRCEKGRFEADETCKGAARCVSEPGSTRCAKPD